MHRRNGGALGSDSESIVRSNRGARVTGDEYGVKRARFGVAVDPYPDYMPDISRVEFLLLNLRSSRAALVWGSTEK